MCNLFVVVVFSFLCLLCQSSFKNVRKVGKWNFDYEMSFETGFSVLVRVFETVICMFQKRSFLGLDCYFDRIFMD